MNNTTIRCYVEMSCPPALRAIETNEFLRRATPDETARSSGLGHVSICAEVSVRTLRTRAPRLAKFMRERALGDEFYGREP